MSHAESYWIFKQLEPNDILRTGNAKIYTPEKKSLRDIFPDFEQRVRDEEIERQRLEQTSKQ